jgi:hypothetical protein
MANKMGNEAGPSCACGKADLYEEWLKQNMEDTISAGTNLADKDSSDNAGNEDPKPEQTR